MVIVIMKGKAWLTVKLTTMRYSGIKKNLSIFPKLVSRSFFSRFVDEFDLPLDKNKVTQCASKIIKELCVWKQD